MSKTLVIVPTYNERENLPRVAERLLHLAVEVDMLVVDDNSPDGTGKLADELAAKNPRVHELHRQEKRGLGRAYLAAFAWEPGGGTSSSSWRWTAIFPRNPDDIPKFLEAAQNADLVLGSRYCGGIRVINWPMRRLLLSTGAAQYVQIVTGMSRSPIRPAATNVFAESAPCSRSTSRRLSPMVTASRSRRRTAFG